MPADLSIENILADVVQRLRRQATRTQRSLQGELPAIIELERPTVTIADISTDRLRDLERRYLERGLTKGGTYSLFDVRIELRRRRPSDFDIREVAARIVELARASPDGATTYKALWDSLLPGRPWKGNNSQKMMANTLGRVIVYCHQNKLPVLTALVVNASVGDQTDKAIANIAQECRDLGMDTGPNDRDFVKGQAERARDIAVESLPAETPVHA